MDNSDTFYFTIIERKIIHLMQEITRSVYNLYQTKYSRNC